MDPIKKILFASNLSSEMATAFKYAATMAVHHNARIIVVHVMEEDVRSEKRMKTAFGSQLYQDLKSEHRQGARNLLVGKNEDALRIRQAITGFLRQDETRDNDTSSGLISKILVTESRSIADDITVTAIDEACDIIVMGCRQQGLLAEAMGDNVVRQVLRRTTVPVFVVPFKK